MNKPTKFATTLLAVEIVITVSYFLFIYFMRFVYFGLTGDLSEVFAPMSSGGASMTVTFLAGAMLLGPGITDEVFMGSDDS